jgi:hypothetical protein
MKTVSEILGRSFTVGDIITPGFLHRACWSGGRTLINHVEPSLHKPFFEREIYPSKKALLTFGCWLEGATSLTHTELDNLFGSDIPNNLFLGRRKDNLIPTEVVDQYFHKCDIAGTKEILRDSSYNDAWSAWNRRIICECPPDSRGTNVSWLFNTDSIPSLKSKPKSVDFALRDALASCNITLKPTDHENGVVFQDSYSYYITYIDYKTEMFRVDDFPRKWFTLKSLTAEHFKETLNLHPNICTPRS